MGFDVSDKKMDYQEIDLLDGRGDDDDVHDFVDGEIENETVEDESPDNSHAERQVDAGGGISPSAVYFFLRPLSNKCISLHAGRRAGDAVQ